VEFQIFVSATLVEEVGVVFEQALDMYVDWVASSPMQRALLVQGHS
jgi:hypothetical protein